MKKIIILSLVMLAFAGNVYASEPIVIGNGNPEFVVNVWGTKNADLPKIKQGETKQLSNGEIFTCPSWFPFYCVDVSVTNWFRNRK